MTNPTLLYCAPFTCTVAVRIELARLELPHETRHVSRGPARQVPDDALAALNPMRKVPTLVLPDGEVLTEMVAVLLHLDESTTERAPAERRRLVNWLAFVATELHKMVLAPAFDPETPDEAITDARARLLPPVLAHVEAHLATSPFLMGADPCGVDAYLLWAVLLLRFRWPEAVDTPALTRFRRAMLAFPHVPPILADERARLGM